MYDPVNLLVDVVREVTVTSTRNVAPFGELVIVKLFTDVDEFLDSVKNGVLPATSVLADTSILTPPVGIVDLIVTVNGKSGPGAGA